MPRGPQPPEPLLDMADVAALTGLSPRTLMRHIASKQLPGRKVGHVWRFKLSELEKWWAEQPGTPAPLHQIAQRSLQQELSEIVMLCTRVQDRPDRQHLLKALEAELAALAVRLRAALQTLNNGTHEPPEETE